MKDLFLCLICVLLLTGLAGAGESTRAQRVEKANLLYEEGRKMVEQGDYASANDRFAKAQDLLDQGSPSAGRQEPPAGRQAPAVPDDKEKVRRADFLYNEAVKAIKGEEFKKAQSCLEEAVELNPKDKDAYYNLGIIYERHLKDKSAAARCYVRYVLLETDPGKAGIVRDWLKELKKGAVQ